MGTTIRHAVQYRKILELREDDFVTLNNLAMVMAIKGEDLSKAMEYVNRAIDVGGPLPMYLDSKAAVLLASGNAKEALKTMQRAVGEKPKRITKETDPINARQWGEYYFHLALAYQANEQKGKGGSGVGRIRGTGIWRRKRVSTGTGEISGMLSYIGKEKK